MASRLLTVVALVSFDISAVALAATSPIVLHGVLALAAATAPRPGGLGEIFFQRAALRHPSRVAILAQGPAAILCAFGAASASAFVGLHRRFRPAQRRCLCEVARWSCGEARGRLPSSAEAPACS